MPGAQKLRSEAHVQVRRNDEVEAQRRRWTFYETIITRGRKNYQGETGFLGFTLTLAFPALTVSNSIHR
jgi:hypothetical protein